MKGYSNFKKFVIIVLCVFIVGLGCYGVGSFMGGSIYNFSHSIRFNSWGNHNYDYDEYDDYDYDYTEYEYTDIDFKDIKEIQVDSQCASISIEGKSERNKLNYTNFKPEEFLVTLENGILKIDTRKRACPSRGESPEIELHLMQSVVADKIKINSDLGEISVDDLESKVFDITAALGSVDLENIISDDFSCIAQLGEIDIEGDLRGSTHLEAMMGSINLKLRQPISEYYYEIEVNLGSAYIDGKESNGINSKIEGGNSEKTNKLKIVANLGDVDVETSTRIRD